MGNPKQKWTSEEEEALRAGVAKHGTGKWKDIQRDPEFNPFLLTRSNIDLKDKWRNMSVSSQGPRDKSRAPKLKATHDISSAQLAVAETSTVAPDANDANPSMDDSPKGLADGKNTSRYNAMIFEALTTLKEPNGLDISTIVSFIEKRHEVPQNFKRLLSSRLRRLVAREKLEKIQHCFKMKTDTTTTTTSMIGIKTPTPKQDIRPRTVQPTNYWTSRDPLEEAATAAAYKMAEAESKSFLASDAVKEAERISKMAEDTDCLLQLANELFEQCSRGEIVMRA